MSDNNENIIILRDRWEELWKSLNSLEDRNARLAYTVKIMKPLVDSLAKDYFEPGPDKGVCHYCDAGGSFYNPERHSDGCPAFVAWLIKPGMDKALSDFEDISNLKHIEKIQSSNPT